MEFQYYLLDVNCVPAACGLQMTRDEYVGTSGSFQPIHLRLPSDHQAQAGS
jgi:hypothetical protein